jgi:hypothetical protein
LKTVIRTGKWNQNKILSCMLHFLRKETFLGQPDSKRFHVLRRISEQHRFEGPKSPVPVLLPFPEAPELNFRFVSDVG